MTIRRPCRAFAAALALCCGSAAAVENRPFSQRLVDDAAKLVKAGDLRGALGKFREAYAAAPDREILFNIGVTYEVLAERGGGPDDMRLGIDSFERYLKTRPPRAADRAEARASLAKLREMLFKATGERPKQVERKLPRKVHASRVRCETPDGKMAEPASLKQPATAAPVVPAVPVPKVVSENRATKPIEPPRPAAATHDPSRAAGTAPSPAPAPASVTTPWWSPLRLSLTVATAVIGLAGFSVGIWRLVEEGELAQMAQLESQAEPRNHQFVNFLWDQSDRVRNGALVAFSIGGAALLTSIAIAAVPQISTLRAGRLTAAIVPAMNGFFITGTF